MTHFRAPGNLPPFSVLLDHLNTRDQAAIARHLDVSARTLSRWQRTDAAPRLAQLAIFWETHYGLGVVHADAVNGERVALGWARALERETAMLRARIQRLEETGDFGAANAPLWRVG